MARTAVIRQLPQVGRKTRRPSHLFNVRFRPWSLQPFMIAPVLPGDTMKNLLMQGSCVTDPLRSPRMGWWHETYFFYVKLRDVASNPADRAAIETMLIANGSLDEFETGAWAPTYHNGGGIDWTSMCMRSIVRAYFRSEEERQDTTSPHINATVDSNFQCKVNLENWMESMKAGSDAPFSDGDPLPGDAFPELPEHLSGFADAYAQWKEMQHLQLAPATFADYLRTAGVRVPKAEQPESDKPELLRYARNWKEPSVSVDPSTGAVVGSVVWDAAERADKDRFFSEPGFVIGVTTCRPKVFYKHQTAAMSHFLDDAFSWLPALLRPDPFTSLKKFIGGTGPVPIASGPDYWVDLADLFMNGDQFVNYNLSTIADDHKLNTVSLPRLASLDADIDDDTTLNKEYATDADGLALFADTANTSAAKNYIRFEGRVDLTVLSSVVDTTP